MIEGKRKVITWSLVLVAAQIADALSTHAVFAALPGASEANLTFRVTDASGRNLVLRRPPITGAETGKR